MTHVVAALLLDGTHVLIARRASGQPHEGAWEFPGGKLEHNEVPERALQREIHEEFGISTSVGEHFQEVTHAYPGGVVRLTAYWTMLDAGTPTPHVHDQIAWVEFHDLVNYGLLPADVPIAQSLAKLGPAAIPAYVKLQPGDVLDNEGLMRTFQCGISGGMRRSKRTNALVVVSDPFKATYRDVWREDTFHYTGMGLTGPQSLAFAQNKTVHEHPRNGVTLYLFEVHEPKRYTFTGRVQCTGPAYAQKQEDSTGALRTVCVFPFQPVEVHSGYAAPTSDLKRVNEMVENRAKKLDSRTLQQRAERADGPPGIRSSTTTVYERDPYVAEFALQGARGHCQLCEQPAPFCKRSGEPYLEVHHIEWLSQGGDDTIENTVALCPNCHRKMHILDNVADKSKLRAAARTSSLHHHFS